MPNLTKLKVAVHEGVIRPDLVKELEAFQAPDQRVGSVYLDLDPQRWGNFPEFQRGLKATLGNARQEIESSETRHEVRQSLLHDLDLVEEVAPTAYGERFTRGLACFIGSEAGEGHVLRLPWPVRERFFYEDRFVLWPLKLILDQSDRYAIILTDKAQARMFLFFLERLEEVAEIQDELPGRIRFPVRNKEIQYRNRHVESYHQHFDNVSETALRWLQREAFEHLIIGCLSEVMPAFESRLHRYLRDRIVARWDVDDLHDSHPQILERARLEEQQLLDREAQATWQTIRDDLPYRGALGPEDVFAALWRLQVDTLLQEPEVERTGFRCTNCTRLSLDRDPCVECGSDTKADVDRIFEEALLDGIDQGAHVRYWTDPRLRSVESMAALKRFPEVARAPGTV
jgi:peptide subunit release factor 1 (eRF1)